MTVPTLISLMVLQYGADGGLEEVYEEIAVIDQEVGGEGED